MSDTVLLERDGGVATLTLNRPDRMNGLTVELMETLLERLHQVARDDDVRCVVLTGTGDRAFSAGADLEPGGATQASRETTLERSIDDLQHWQESSWLLHTMPKPTVAALNGAAAGASLSMACACDFRVAVDHAVLRTAFSGIGFSGDFGGAYFVTAMLGTAKARELYMLAEKIGADRALELGLVHRVFPAETFRKEADEFARLLAEGPPLAYRYMKRNLNLALTAHLRDVMDLEAEAMMRTGRSEDWRNAVQAFLAKEKPTFEGK